MTTTVKNAENLKNKIGEDTDDIKRLVEIKVQINEFLSGIRVFY